MVCVHFHDPASQGVLCGAQQPRASTDDPDAVTCPLCGALLDGRAVVHRVLDVAQQRVTRKLAELQRDPGVRMLSAFALSVLRADKAAREQRQKGGP